MKIIILAGGKGMRLWPLSRLGFPKQFLKIGKETSLFRQTLDRAFLLAKPDDIFVSTGKDNVLNVKRDLRSSGLSEKNIILREDDKETAYIIFDCLERLKNDFKVGRKEVIVVLPSDHFISPDQSFVEDIKEASKIAEVGTIVTLGIRPTSPETGYGYIRMGNKRGSHYQVEAFVEKPNKPTAISYLEDGNYLWNSGMFIFSLGFMLKEFQNHAPDIRTLEKSRALSFDKAVIEKSKHLACLPASFTWTDVGSFGAFYEVSQKNEVRNSIVGNVLTHNVENSLILGKKKLIVGVNLKDLVVVDSEDALLVASLQDTAEIKKVVEKLDLEKRSELKFHSPYFSVCIIIQSQEDFDFFLENTLPNIFAQHYTNIECVVLNAGALSWNQEIQNRVADYHDHYKIVHIINAQIPFQNSYEAMNVCLKEVTGEVVGFLKNRALFADEFSVSLVMQALEEKQADIAWGNMVYVDKLQKDRVVRLYQSSPYKNGSFLKGWHPPYDAFFARKKIYDLLGGYRLDLIMSADYELMLRFLEKHKMKSCWVPRIVVKVEKESDFNIKKIAISNFESYKAFKLNDIKVSPAIMVTKPLLKISQFINKKIA